MKRLLLSTCLLIAFSLVAEEGNIPSWFKGKIGKSYKDSEPFWPAPVQAPKDAPNILFIVLDDVGFGHISAFGGAVDTPYLDKLANEGLRYNNFHTTALCSPTRSAFITGRNHHSNGMGAITELSTGFPGYNGHMSFENGTVAEVLHQNGYNTYAVGKWHLTPDEETSQSGPYDRWPLGRGFDHFYGFMGGETDQWTPELWLDNTRIDSPARENYHLSVDLVDKAMSYIREEKAVTPEKPFFVYLAFGAGHAPHQVPKEWIEKYKGKFDKGWDKIREEILTRQKELGVVPKDTVLPPRNPGVKAWDELPADEKKLYARMNEVYAGFVAHADYQIGRLIDYLRKSRNLDNTLVIVAVGDNGASQEGGPTGSVNENRFFNNVPEDLKKNLQQLDQLGSEFTYNHYPIGWAMAGNTPFKRWKQDASNEGGTRNPLILFWPAKIKDNGGVRSQFHHAIDIVPTLYEIIGITPPSEIKGYKQSPIEGVSMAYTFDQPEAKSKHDVQYFEMFGNRALYKDGWKALTWHKQGDDFDKDKWELYHLDIDWTEVKDLAQESPEKLKELKDLFEKEAWKYNVFPLDDRRQERLIAVRPNVSGERDVYIYYPGISQIPESTAVNVKNRSFTIIAEVDTPKEGTEGVLVAHGGRFGGYSFYVKEGKLKFAYNFVDDLHFTIASTEAVPRGKSTLRFEFQRIEDKPGPAGIGTLYIDGKKVGEGKITSTEGYRLSLGEGLDIGRDSGTPVTNDYKSPFPFTGTLEKVTIEVGKKYLTDPAKLGDM